MIDKKAFLEIMADIAEQHRKENALSQAVSECFDNMVYINENKNLEALLKLAKATFDPDSLIEWFEFDHANFDLILDGEKVTVDTPEKLYDYLDKEYPYTPEMIGRGLFLEILQLIEEQDEINRKLGMAFEDYSEGGYIIIPDSYHSALVKMMESTFAFCETLSYWLHEDGTSFEADGVEIDISTPDALYDCLCQEFIECGGKPLAPVKNGNVKAISEGEFKDLLKKQLLGIKE